MPSLYEIEDFERCLYSTTEESLYCLVISEIVPNNSIPLWNQIQTFSSYSKIHYHHDKLVNGICVNRCKNILELPETEQRILYGGKLTDLDLNTHINNVYSSQNEKRLKYNKLLNQCLNYKFTKNYNLMLRSNIEYCVSNKDTIQIELLDVLFGCLIGLILLLTIASSYYDFTLKKKVCNDMERKQHYKKSISEKSKLGYLSFSICRNYYRLIAPGKSESSFARDLRFFEAFRVFMMLGVLANHMTLGLNSIGFANPNFIESVFHLFLKCLLTNGTLIMQTFFGMSGFLLTLIYVEQEKKQKIQNYFGTFIKFVVLRFLRLTPIYAIAIFFATTWYTKLGNGPFWMHGTETDKIYCSKYWWANLLYINNYVGTDQLCIAQAWYLGVDFQLFIMSLLLLMLLSKYPKTKYFVYIGGFIVSMLFIIITCVTIDFEGIYFPSPEFFRYSTVFESYFKYFFITAHTNIGGYLSGIIFGKIYLDLKERNYKLGENKKFILLWYTVIPLAFVIVFSAELFYNWDVREEALLMGIYFAFTKNLYALISATILLGMCFKIGWIGYEFSSLSIFRIPGRLTYCAFIIHAFIVRLPAGEYYQPVQFSMILMINQFFGKLILTYVISFFITLLIELPISSIIKIIMDTGGEKKKPKMVENNDDTQEMTNVDKTTSIA